LITLSEGTNTIVECRLEHFSLTSQLIYNAMCIDQRNIEERELQVLRMRDIYSTAKSVVAWIGEETNYTPIAITFLEAAARGGVQFKFKTTSYPVEWLDCYEDIFGRSYRSRT
jgi:pyruvate-formate lyase-activating enzyme